MRLDAWAFLLLTAIAWAVRAVGMTHHGLAIDEPFTLFHAQFPVDKMLVLLKGDNHPPLFELLLHFWIGCFGDSEFAIRIIPVTFGALCAGFLYLVGKETFSPRVGLIAGILMAFGERQIFYAHETRGYTLLLLLTLVTTWQLLRWMRSGHWGWWLALVLTYVVFFYSHYFSIVVLAMQGLWALFAPGGPRRKVLWLLAALALILLAFAPYASRLLGAFANSTGNHWVPPAGPKNLQGSLAKLTQSLTMGLIALGTMLAAVVLYFVRKPKGTQGKLSKVWLALLIFPITFLIFWVAGALGVPVFLGRYIHFTSGALLLLWAGATAYVFRGKLQIWAEGLLLVGFIVSTNFHPNHQDEWPKVAQDLRRHTDQGGGVLFIPAWGARGLNYYYDREAFRDPDHTVQRIEAQGIFTYVINEKHSFNPSRWNQLLIVKNGSFAIEIDSTLQQELDSTFMVDSVTTPYNGIEYTWMTRKH
jgi:hypothetical protein